MIITVLETSIKKAIAIITIVKQCRIIGSLIELNSKKKTKCKNKQQSFSQIYGSAGTLIIKKMIL